MDRKCIDVQLSTLDWSCIIIKLFMRFSKVLFLLV
uniref:Uncharacterized protein n=1 Tax=Rhizophora mucronata TaxID=61149 RepID=A0A2P2NSX9_RHIMU